MLAINRNSLRQTKLLIHHFPLEIPSHFLSYQVHRVDKSVLVLVVG